MALPLLHCVCQSEVRPEDAKLENCQPREDTGKRAEERGAIGKLLVDEEDERDEAGEADDTAFVG